MTIDQVKEFVRVALKNQGARTMSQEAAILDGLITRSNYYRWIAGDQDIGALKLERILDRCGLKLLVEV